MRLQYKITLLIFVILLFFGIIGGGVMLQLQRRSIISQFDESIQNIASIVQDDLEDNMLSGNRSIIQETVTDIVSETSVVQIAIFSNNRRIYAAVDTSVIGEIREDDEELALVLTSGEMLMRSDGEYSNNMVTLIHPIKNQLRCQGEVCHSPEVEILGALEVGMDRKPLDDQLKEQTLVMALIGGLTLIVVGVALAFGFRSALVRPLSKLTASAYKIAQGDFSARVEVGRKDEVRAMAKAFNNMAEKVEQYAQALESSKRELEQKIKERTREVQKLATVRGELLQRVISAQEDERLRIAHELHDMTAQNLALMVRELAMAMEALPDDASKSKETLSRSKELASQSLADLRSLIYDLRPEALEHFGLAAAVRSYAKKRLGAENIEVTFDLAGMEERLSSRVETSLFRIIQEAITNIVRHSGASKVNIQMEVKESLLIATIADNGVGFNFEAEINKPDSWGLRGIIERVTMFGGQLTIESEAGAGTRIRLQVPLEKR